MSFCNAAASHAQRAATATVRAAAANAGGCGLTGICGASDLIFGPVTGGFATPVPALRFGGPAPPPDEVG